MDMSALTGSLDALRQLNPELEKIVMGLPEDLNPEENPEEYLEQLKSKALFLGISLKEILTVQLKLMFPFKLPKKMNENGEYVDSEESDFSEEELEDFEEEYEESIKEYVNETIKAKSQLVQGIINDMKSIIDDIKSLPMDVANIIGTVSGIATCAAVFTSAPAAVPLIFGLISQISDLIKKIMGIIAKILKLGLAAFAPIATLIQILLAIINLLKQLRENVKSVESVDEDGNPTTISVESPDPDAEVDLETLQGLVDQLQEALPEEPEPAPEPEPQPELPDINSGNWWISIGGIQGRGDNLVTFFNSRYLSNLRDLNIDNTRIRPLSSGYVFSDYDYHDVTLVFQFSNGEAPEDLFNYNTVSATTMSVSSSTGSSIVLSSTGPSNVGSIELSPSVSGIRSGSISNTGATILTLQGPPPTLENTSELDNIENLTLPSQYRLLYQSDPTWSGVLRQLSLNANVQFSDNSNWEEGGRSLSIREVNEGTYPILTIVQPGAAGCNDSVKIDFSTGQIIAASFSGSGEFLSGIPKKEIYTNQELQPIDGVVEWIIEHNLGTEDVVCRIKDTGTKKEIGCEIEYTDESTVKVRINSIFPILEGTYKAVIIG